MGSSARKPSILSSDRLKELELQPGGEPGSGDIRQQRRDLRAVW